MLQVELFIIAIRDKFMFDVIGPNQVLSPGPNDGFVCHLESPAADDWNISKQVQISMRCLTLMKFRVLYLDDRWPKTPVISFLSSKTLRFRIISEEYLTL